MPSGSTTVREHREASQLVAKQTWVDRDHDHHRAGHRQPRSHRAAPATTSTAPLIAATTVRSPDVGLQHRPTGIATAPVPRAPGGRQVHARKARVRGIKVIGVPGRGEPSTTARSTTSATLASYRPAAA